MEGSIMKMQFICNLVFATVTNMIIYQHFVTEMQKPTHLNSRAYKNIAYVFKYECECTKNEHYKHKNVHIKAVCIFDGASCRYIVERCRNDMCQVEHT